MTHVFKPSQVLLTVPPLTATMGKSEVEHAAALIVRCCQALGDAWQPVTWSQVQEVLRKDLSEKREPFASLVSNPFFRPDVHELTRLGFASHSEAGHELTAAGIAALRRWAVT